MSYIPLHIADAAVAACEAEIQKLREENFRLIKAGDKMAAALNGEFNHELPCVQDWSLAKRTNPNPSQPNA